MPPTTTTLRSSFLRAAAQPAARTTAGDPPPAAPSAPSSSKNESWIHRAVLDGTFQQDRDWGFCYTPVEKSAVGSYEVDQIDGAVPPDLRGTHYKIGPGRFERGGQRYAHTLDGDGFVTALRFEGGGGQRVTYTGRFVETEYYRAEEAANGVRFRNVFGTQRPGGWWANAFDLNLKNVANTNVLKWGGRLWALWEAGRPYELDPQTLETLPPTGDGPLAGLGRPDCRIRSITVDDGGPVDRLLNVAPSFTAHPHVLDGGDTLVAFTSRTNVKTRQAILDFIEYDRDWNPRRVVPYAFDRGPPPHDFSVSLNYYCFFQNPFAEMDSLPYLLGLKAPTEILQLRLRDQPTTLHLVPRDAAGGGGKDPLTVQVPPYFNIHNVAQAQETEDGQFLVLHSNGWDLRDERFFPHSLETVPFLGNWGGLYPDFEGGVVPPALFYKTVVDLTSGRLVCHEEVCPGTVMDFPVQDEQRPHHVYTGIAATDAASWPNHGFAKFDTEASTVEYWFAPDRCFTNEAVPVRKRNGEEGSWLLGMLYDAASQRTSLAILDSEDIAAGPVCRLHLKHHLTYGLHGSFAAE